MFCKVVSVLAAFTIVAGCAAPSADPAGDLAFPLVDPGSAEEAGMLALVNDASTTFAVLDDDAALDRRAAENIVAARDGADAAHGTADDMPFTSIDQLDAIAYVGPTALEKLLVFARDNGWLDVGAAQRDAATLALVNDPATTFERLDIDVALDRRAAANIIAHRAGADAMAGTADDQLFASIAELDAISYVGPSALNDLAAYALAHGYGDDGAPAPVGCVLISEVVEGSGNYNKAVELYNCGTENVALEDLGFCLVRNDETTCSVTSAVGAGTLAAGDTWVICRSRAEALSDPFAGLVAACDQEVGTVASFNGDDRLVVFHDIERNGSFDGGDAILDVFGELASRPASAVWADGAFRRCDLTPHLGGAFNTADTFRATRLGEGSVYDHLGVAPTNDCAPVILGGEGDDCVDTATCEAGLRCQGVPRDGSSSYGKCIDTSPIAGEGARCDRVESCGAGLICAGWTLFGEGNCVPQWMAGRYEAEGPVAIPDAPSAGIASGVVVYGLASVPVDLEVVVHIDHPRPEDLRVTLLDPAGSDAVLWDRSTELQEWSRSFVTTGGISRDDEVNGRWQLRFEDVVAGQSGTFESWSLFVVSRWD